MQILYLSCHAKTTMKTNNHYHPKICTIFSTADVSEEEDGLANFSGLDASGAKALLTLLKQLDLESLKRLAYFNDSGHRRNPSTIHDKEHVIAWWGNPRVSWRLKG